MAFQRPATAPCNMEEGVKAACTHFHVKQVLWFASGAAGSGTPVGLSDRDTQSCVHCDGCPGAGAGPQHRIRAGPYGQNPLSPCGLFHIMVMRNMYI